MAYKIETREVKVETWRCPSCKQADRDYDMYTGICEHSKGSLKK